METIQIVLVAASVLFEVPVVVLIFTSGRARSRRARSRYLVRGAVFGFASGACIGALLVLNCPSEVISWLGIPVVGSIMGFLYFVILWRSLRGDERLRRLLSEKADMIERDDE